MEFQAVVVDVREEWRGVEGARWQVQLDRTNFREGDTGVLEATARSGARLRLEVVGVVVSGDGVWHVVRKPLGAGTEVTGRVEAGGGC